MHLITELATGLPFGDLHHWHEILSAILNAGRTEGSGIQDAANGVGGVSAAGGLASAMGSGPNSSTGTPPSSQPPSDYEPQLKDARGSEQGYHGGTATHGGYSHPDGFTGDQYYPGDALPPNINPSWPLYFVLPPALHHLGPIGKFGGLIFDSLHAAHDLYEVPGHGAAPGPDGSSHGGH